MGQQLQLVPPEEDQSVASKMIANMTWLITNGYRTSHYFMKYTIVLSSIFLLHFNMDSEDAHVFKHLFQSAQQTALYSHLLSLKLKFLPR